MAKLRVFVLVAHTVGYAAIADTAQGLLDLHRHRDHHNFDDPTARAGQYSYGVGPLHDGLSDPLTCATLPSHQKRRLEGRICDIERLSDTLRPGAVVTPDGVWHGGEGQPLGFWETDYRNLMDAQTFCWVVEHWVYL
jgi:hypothetical protein